MKVLILYFSRTGNTKKLAEEIARGVVEVEGVQAVIRSTADVSKEDFVEADGIIAGSPVYFGSMAAPLKDVLDKFVGVRKKMENKVGAGGTIGTGAAARAAAIRSTASSIPNSPFSRPSAPTSKGRPPPRVKSVWTRPPTRSAASRTRKSTRRGCGRSRTLHVPARFAKR